MMYMLLMWITIFVLNGFVYMVRKRLRIIEMYVTSLFSIYLALFADSILGGMFKLYSYFEAGVDWIDFVGAIGIYPAINILFLAFFPAKKNLIIKGMYILGWTLFALCYEFVAAHYSTFFQYSGWRLIYSVPIYPILYMILLYNFRFVNKLLGVKKTFFHLTPLEWYGSLFFILYMNLFIDAVLKGRYELYYYVVKDVHPFDFFYRLILLCVPLLIFLSRQANYPTLWRYLIWIAVLSVIQQCTAALNLFHTNNWNISLSIVQFAIILLLTWLNLWLLRHMKRGTDL
ncbi:CBO0543 family protein [Rossellomorea aquimaris]|uniref:CBO0543 family protein n=1 Tax=Rossellomorea aquimaris TaxID=189382 RepID=UPI003CF0359C